MSLRAFHLVFIVLSVVLAAFMAAWAAGQYRLEPDAGYLATALALDPGRGRADDVLARFQRKTRNL